MASPQKENGYTPIANELLEAIFKAKFSGNEIRVLLWVMRKSYGWNSKKTKPIGIRQMALALDAPQSSIQLAISILMKCGVIERDDNYCYSVNKNHECWKIPRGDRVTKCFSYTFLKSAQPTGHHDDARVPSPLGKSAQPTGQSAQPTGQSAQPTGQYMEKATKRNLKASKETEIPPALDSIKTYCLERKNGIDPQLWHDHYAAKGWMIGKNRMRDWRAAVRTWERNSFSPKKDDEDYGRKINAYIKAEREGKC